MHYQSWLWLSVVQENILQRSKGKGHQRQYHFTRGGGGGGGGGCMHTSWGANLKCFGFMQMHSCVCSRQRKEV